MLGFVYFIFSINMFILIESFLFVDMTIVIL